MPSVKTAAKTEIALVCDGTGATFHRSVYQDFARWVRGRLRCLCPVCGREVLVEGSNLGDFRFANHGGLHVR